MASKIIGFFSHLKKEKPWASASMLEKKKMTPPRRSCSEPDLHRIIYDKTDKNNNTSTGYEARKINKNFSSLKRPSKSFIVDINELNDPFINYMTIPSEMIRDEWKLKDYTFIDTINTSQNSVVYTALCKKSKIQVALKVLSLANRGENQINDLIREININFRLFHNNIVPLYAAFKERNYIVLVFKMCSRDLSSKTKERLPENNVKNIISGILQGLDYIHEKNIVHRDIKLDNIVLGKNNVPMICDFGFAVDSTENVPTTPCGTQGYTAPEISLRRDPYDNKCDIYSIGIITYELLIGMKPVFKDSTLMFPRVISNEAREFILACLFQSPALRPTCKQLFLSKWIS